MWEDAWPQSRAGFTSFGACLLCNVYVQCATVRLTDSLGRYGTGSRSAFGSELCFLLTPLFTYVTFFCSSFWSLFSRFTLWRRLGSFCRPVFVAIMYLSPSLSMFSSTCRFRSAGPHRCRRLPVGSSDSSRLPALESLLPLLSTIDS